MAVDNIHPGIIYQSPGKLTLVGADFMAEVGAPVDRDHKDIALMFLVGHSFFHEFQPSVIQADQIYTGRFPAGCPNRGDMA